MGAFDDLIPAAETAKGAFDDLVPPPESAKGAFADLIPAKEAAPAPVPVAPSMDTAVPPQPPSLLDRALTAIGEGVRRDAEGQSTGARVAASQIAGMAAAPVAGIYGLMQGPLGDPAGQDPTKAPEWSIDEANRRANVIHAIPQSILRTPEDKALAQITGEAIGTPFKMAGAGLGGLAELPVTGLQGATDVIEGRSEGSSIGVPIAKVLGEVSSVFGFGGIPKAIRSIPNETWFRMMVNKNRELSLRAPTEADVISEWTALRREKEAAIINKEITPEQFKAELKDRLERKYSAPLEGDPPASPEPPPEPGPKPKPSPTEPPPEVDPLQAKADEITAALNGKPKEPAPQSFGKPVDDIEAIAREWKAAHPEGAVAEPPPQQVVRGPNGELVIEKPITPPIDTPPGIVSATPSPKQPLPGPSIAPIPSPIVDPGANLEAVLKSESEKGGIANGQVQAETPVEGKPAAPLLETPVVSSDAKSGGSSPQPVTIYRGRQVGQADKPATWWTSSKDMAQTFADSVKGKKPRTAKETAEVIEAVLPEGSIFDTGMEVTEHPTIAQIAQKSGIPEAEIRAAMAGSSDPLEKGLATEKNWVRLHVVLEGVGFQNLLRSKGITAIKAKEIVSKDGKTADTYLMLRNPSSPIVPPAPSSTTSAAPGGTVSEDGGTLSNEQPSAYLDDKGNEVYVDKGPFGNFSYYRKLPVGGRQRIVVRGSDTWFKTKEEAEAGLNEYAGSRGWKWQPIPKKVSTEVPIEKARLNNLFSEVVRTDVIDKIETEARDLSKQNILFSLPVKEYALSTFEQKELIKRGMTFDVDRMGNPIVRLSQKARETELRDKVMGKQKEKAEAVPESIIPYTRDLKIANIATLPRGVGTRYLEVIRGENGQLVAKQWRRKLVPGSILVDMEPGTPEGSKPIPVAKGKKPLSPEVIARNKALMEDPMNQAVDFIIKNGYLNTDSVKATFGIKAAIKLNRRFFNRAPFGKIGSIVRPDGKLGLDEVADEFPGIFGNDTVNPDEHLLDVLLDRSKIGKPITDDAAIDKLVAENGKRQQEEYEYDRKHEISEKLIELERYGLAEADIIEIARGDGFSDDEIISALKAKIIEETARDEEFAEFSPEEIAGELDRLIEQDALLDAEAMSEGVTPKPSTAADFIGKNDTGELGGGLSEADTFSLVNEETGIATGDASSKKDMSPTAGMFDDQKAPSGTASTGPYANEERTAPKGPNAEAIRNAYIANPKLYLELPEIVEFAMRAMDGSFPKVRRFLGAALGRFHSSGGQRGLIELINNMDLDTLSKVLAHEIGHLMDWFPDKDIARGNILGRIASIPGYLKSLLEEYPGAPGKVLTPADRERLHKEAARQIKGSMPDEDIVTYITRTVPKYEDAGITATMILDLLKGLTNEPKNVLDFLKSVDGKVKAEIAKKAMKDLVDERLKDMVGKKLVGTETITEEIRQKREFRPERIAARYRELIREEIEKRRLYQKQVITQELKDLTLKWKPFTPSADSYTKYRFSSVELYADAVSVLFNDPNLLQQTAPTFWKAFMNYFERKPELKAIYDELQARRANPDAVMEQRRKFQRGMAEEGAQIRSRNAELIRKMREMTPSKLWHAFKMALGDENIRALELVQKAIREKRPLEDHQRIDYWVEELQFINSKVHAFEMSVENRILQEIEKAGINIIDLHEYMINDRAATERKGIYNPGGIGDRFATAQLDYMKKVLGDEKFGKVVDLVNQFREIYLKKVTERVAEADFLPPDLINTMLNNPHYATFSNLDYLEMRDPAKTGDTIHAALVRALGSGATAHIYKQYGMLGKVDNVFVQTVLKGLALIRAAEHHKTKMGLIHSGVIGPVIRARRGHKGVGWQKPKDPSLGLIVVSPGGKPTGYYIDKEIADLWNTNPDKANVVTAVGMAITSATKAVIGRLFIAWNLGWTVANPPRDAWATWKKIPEAQGALARGFYETFRDAWEVGMGRFPAREERLLEEGKTVPARFYNEPKTQDQMESEFVGKIDDPILYANKYIKPFLIAAKWIHEHENILVIPRLLRGLEQLGKVGERWGKFAADRAIEINREKRDAQYRDYGVLPPKKEAHREANLVRTRAGTPNSLQRGLLYWITEALAPFSNVAIQDLRSSIQAAKESPKGYGFKTAVSNILPKILFAAMVYGIFGDDIKKAAMKVGKYYRRMYINFPIATAWLPDWMKGQLGPETINITIPQDYTGQTISALTDALMSNDWSGNMGTLGLLFENQPYNISPVWSTASDWIGYYALDRAPQDSFSGTQTMPKDVADLGGPRAFQHMVRQTYNRFLGTMIYKMKADNVDQADTELKKALGMPVFNAIGRFIRITNTGDVERDMMTMDEIKNDERDKRLNIKEQKIKSINENMSKTPPRKILEMYKKAVDSGDIDPLSTSPMSFAKSYMDMELQRERSTFVRAMQNAGSDRQKAALLLRWKSELPEKDYEATKSFLEKNGLIGAGVGAQLILESRRKENPETKSVLDLLRRK